MARPEGTHAPHRLYVEPLPLMLGFGFFLDQHVFKQSHRYVRLQLRVLNHISVIITLFELHSLKFLPVFFDSQADISLLGEVNWIVT